MIALIILIVIILISLAIYFFRKPLPEWDNLHGEEYLKWKKGEKGKGDITD